MDIIHSRHSIGISDLRKAPARAFERAGDEAVVVLNHNRSAGYIVSGALMARIMDQLAEQVITEKAGRRMTTLGTARKINLKDLTSPRPSQAARLRAK